GRSTMPRIVGPALTPTCRSNDNLGVNTPRSFPMPMAPEPPRLTIRDRVRAPTPDELQSIPWLATLTPAERGRAERHLVVGEAEVGDLVCRNGRAPTFWFGVVEG